jgi:hypothetical protein
VARRNGHLGGSLALPTTTSIASTTGAALAPRTGSWSVAWWQSCRSIGTKWVVGSVPGGYVTIGWGILQLNDGLYLYCRGAGPKFTVANAFRVGSFDRFVATFDAATGTISAYRNGVLLAASGAATFSGDVSDAGFSVGNDAGSGDVGSVADAVLDVGHAWTAAQVASDYFDAGTPGSYTHRWPFDDGAGTTARATRGGLPLTLASGAAFSSDSPMLARGAVRNYVQDSNQVASSANWVNVGLGTTTVYGGSLPAGFTSATLLANDGSTGSHQTRANGGLVAAIPIGRKVFVQAIVKRVSGNDWVALGGNAGGAAKYLRFSTGALGVGGGNAIDSGIDDLGGGWFRLWFSYITTTTPWPSIYMSDADGSVSYTHAANADQVACAGVQLEEAMPGQTSPSPFVITGVAPLSVYGLRDRRQNHLAYSDDLTKWLVQNGSASISAGVISGATANLLLRQLAPVGVGTLVGSVFRYELDVMADAACTVPITLADASDGTPTLQSNLPITTSWVRWSLSMTTASPNAGAIGVYIGDGATFPTGRTVYVRRASLTQSTSSSEFVATNGASANSSGAPRQLAGRGTVTNYTLQTNDVTASPWIVDTLTTAAYGGPFPAGGPQAMRVITDTAAVSVHRCYQSRSGIIPVGTPVVASFYFVRTAGANAVLLACNGAAFYLAVDPSTGTFSALSTAVGTGGVLARNVESLGGGLYRASVLYTTNANDAFLQLYMNNGVSVTYGNGGSPTSIAVGGLMLEIAAPCQTTCSPYIASGATPGVGLRDTRQNMLKGSDSPSFSFFSPSTGDSIATGITDPDGGSTAIAYTYGTATASYAYLSQTVTGLDASKVWTLSMWLRVASGTKALSLCLSNLTVATVYKAITVTTTWQRFSFTLTEKQLAATASGLGVGLAGAAPGDVFQMCRLQLEQANAPGLYVKTTSAPFNPNGAPRVLV